MARVLILIEDLVDEREFIYPYFRFKEAGFEVDVAGKEAREYTGKRGFKGYPLRATITFEEALKREYDVVFVPGGYAPDKLRTYAEVLEILRKAKVIGAVCHGPRVLISAGLIKKGAEVSAYVSLKDDIENAGGVYKKGVSEYEYEGKRIITGSGPDDLPEMMRRILAKIARR